MSRPPRLVFENPEGVAREIFLDEGVETSIGRHPACTITVAQPSVSRRHARIFFEAGGFYIEDLRSSNGTYVNNQRVTRASLTDKDDLRCGDFCLKFGEEAASGTRQVPKVPGKPSIRTVGPLKRRGTSERAPKSRRENAAPRARVPEAREVRLNEPPARREPAPREPAARRPAPPSVPANALNTSDGGEGLASAQAEVRKLRAKLETITSEKAEMVIKVGDLERDVDDRGRRIRELENDTQRTEEQLQTVTDRNLRLKEQVQSQQAQLEEYRQEKIENELALNEAKELASTLRSANNQSGNREAELAEDLNDLKREVRQKEKAIREVERHLEVSEYNLGAARDENENLRLALGEDDSTRKGLNTTIEHLRQVISEKEAMLEQLQFEIGRWQDRAEQAEAAAQDNAADFGETLKNELANARADRDEFERRARNLSAELEELRKRAQEEVPSRRMTSQINELKRANRDLRNDLKDAQAQSGSGGMDQVELAEMGDELRVLRAALKAGEKEVDDLRNQLAKAPASGGSSAAYNELRKSASETFDTLNDLASDLRMNIDVSSGYVEDLRPLVEMVARLDFKALPPEIGGVLQDAVEECDAELTVESADDALKGARTGAATFKKTMRRFREIVQRHGGD